MPDAYMIALALATALFAYVVYQRIRNGQSISTSLLYVPLLLGIAWVFYTLWRDSQEIARLQSEKEKAEEKEKDLKMRAEQARIEGEQEELDRQLVQAESQVEALDEQLKLEENRHEEAVERARSIRTWDDFWGAMGKSPGDEGPPDTDPDP